jgi:hypothetical protein
MRLLDVWDQMFWIPDPTLAFVGLPKMSAIFTVVKAQSAYIARALAGRIDIPSLSDMLGQSKQGLKSREKSRAQNQAGDARLGFHNFNYPKDKDYINKLSRASRIADKKNPGKTPSQFDACLDWTR